MSQDKLQTTAPTMEPLTIEQRAALIHNGLAERRGLPLWGDCSQDIRDMWIKCVNDCDEIGKGIVYEDD